MLLEATDDDFAVLLDGQAPRGLKLPDGPVESPEVLGMLRDLANTIRPAFAPASWMVIESGEIVGLCSLVKAPADGGIDIGYGITENRRRLGFASGAVASLLDWARHDERVATVRAETSVNNLASQRTLDCNGFQKTGVRSDEEDGDLFCWAVSTAQ